MAKRLTSGALRALEAVADLFIVSVLWAVCCLPVVTIGASSAAMYYVVIKVIRRQHGTAARSFFRSFRTNFRPGIPLSIVFTAGCGIMALYYLFGVGIDADSGLYPIYWAVVIIILFIFLSTSAYAFPLLSRFSEKPGAMIKSAFLLGAAAPLKSLGLLCLLALSGAAVYCFVPAAFILLPGLFTLFASFFVEPALLAHATEGEKSLWNEAE